MKRANWWLSILRSTVTFGLLVVLSTRTVLAASLYFSPASGSFTVGDTMVVAVRVNTGGEAINAVSAVVNYPTDKLDFSWIGDAGILSIWAQKTGGGGVVNMAGGKIGSFSGDGQVGSVAFRVKNTGTAALSFAGGSHVVTAAGSRDIYNGGAGASFVLTPGQPVASGSSGIAPVSTASANVISNVRIATSTPTTATITWNTSLLSDSVVEYGIGPGRYIMSASDRNRVFSHQVQLAGLSPETNFYFVVKSADSQGNVKVSAENNFKTPALSSTVKPQGAGSSLPIYLIAGGLVSLILVGGGVYLYWKRTGHN